MKSDVESAVNPCRRFFVLEVEARIVAAGMKELGIEELEEMSQCVPDQTESWSKAKKKDFLHDLSAKIVDKYVLDKARHEKIALAVNQLEEKHLQRMKDKTPNGRFKCRFPGCNKRFSSDGKWRYTHEQSHNPPVSIEEQPLLTEIHEGVIADDVYNYQKALLEYGMVALNFFYAISEGDGARVIRSWKFLLLYLHHDGQSSRKYALEALYMMFQIYALLSPKAAHDLIWNRFSKRRQKLGGNISLDLALEFLNRIFKDAVKKLGPNASTKSINRICHAMGVTKQLTENFDNSMLLYKRSGKHIRRSEKGDMAKIVKQLLPQDALTKTPGRSYGFYSDMKPTLLNNFDLQKFYNWISDHKGYMILHRKAR